MATLISFLTFVSFCFCFGNGIKIEANRMILEKNKKSVGCTSIENVKVASKLKCSILFANRPDVNVADFNVLLSTCELKFCSHVSHDIFKENSDYIALMKSCCKYNNLRNLIIILIYARN